ncbi:Exodeoxyribonuclease VII large subunit [Ruminococcus sp. YE71]|uniref:exodeoxyribonuclease VII large subunit n=1 Tax=unclassified Ruminococcus TaxID=2608920 RepID=UPI00088F81A7|nr:MULTISPECIES: exodeoxyribonuclease VII large subunit [unclassified Ruminococcus]SDA17031.1 Exodeoxyribonuclease VII large subunit [Ruminococcus sp. YE78]SFW25955.1 Exodeoxyribonuclease VII large subunit [Ruminococcus sp. YE71]
MPSVISVSQLTNYITHRLKDDIRLKSVMVKGEISEYKRNASSGHVYFSLREGDALLKCVMWKARADKLGFTPQTGTTVICTGEIAVYRAGGYYQLSATEIVPVGEGVRAMQQKELKEKLTKLGIFKPERKKPIPALPKRIALVTSADGAAIHDVVKTLRRRYPVGEVFFFSAQVQGETAHLTIADTIRKADGFGCDVIIVTRGGGAYDTLSAFNTEEVAMAIADCVTPVISAVGHEIDTTLADYAADRRESTPTAAAEVCAPDISVLTAAADAELARLGAAFEKQLESRRAELERLSYRLASAGPYHSLEKSKTALEGLSARLGRAYSAELMKRNARLENVTGKLMALSPFNVLERGYTITLKSGVPVTRPEQLSEGDTVEIRFSGFTAEAVIRGIHTKENGL